MQALDDSNAIYDIDITGFATIQVYQPAELERKLEKYQITTVDCLQYIQQHTAQGVHFKRFSGSTSDAPLYTSRPYNIHTVKGLRLLFTSFDNILLLLDIMTHKEQDQARSIYFDAREIKRAITRHRQIIASTEDSKEASSPNAIAPTNHSIRWKNRIIDMTNEQIDAVEAMVAKLSAVVIGVPGAGKTLSLIKLFEILSAEALQTQTFHELVFIGPKAVVKQMQRQCAENHITNEFCSVNCATVDEFLRQQNPDLQNLQPFSLREIENWITNQLKQDRKLSRKNKKYPEIDRESPERLLQEFINMSYIDPLSDKYNNIGASQSLYPGVDNHTRRTEILQLYKKCLAYIASIGCFNAEICDPGLHSPPAAWRATDRKALLCFDEAHQLTPLNILTMLKLAQRNPDLTPRIIGVFDNAQNTRSRIANYLFYTQALSRLPGYAQIPVINLNKNLRCPAEIINMLRKIRTIAELNCGIAHKTAEGNIHRAHNDSHPGELIWYDHADNHPMLNMIQKYARDPNTVNLAWTKDLAETRAFLNIADNSGILYDIRNEAGGIDAATIICYNLFNCPELDDCIIPDDNEPVKVRTLKRNDIDEQDLLVFFNILYVALSRSIHRVIIINNTGKISRLEQEMRRITSGHDLTPLIEHEQNTPQKAVENAQQMLDNETHTLEEALAYLQHHVDEETSLLFIERNTPLTAELVIAKITEESIDINRLNSPLAAVAASITLQNEIIELLENSRAKSITDFFIDLCRYPNFLILSVNNSTLHPFLQKLVDTIAHHMEIIYKSRNRVAPRLAELLATIIPDGRFANCSMLFALASITCGQDLLFHLAYNLNKNQVFTIFERTIANSTWTIGTKGAPENIPLLVLPNSRYGVYMFNILLSWEHIVAAMRAMPAANFATVAPVRVDPLDPDAMYHSPTVSYIKHFYHLVNDDHIKCQQSCEFFFSIIGSDEFFQLFYYQPERHNHPDNRSGLEKIFVDRNAYVKFIDIFDKKSPLLEDICEKWDFQEKPALICDDHGLRKNTFMHYICASSAVIFIQNAIHIRKFLTHENLTCVPVSVWIEAREIILNLTSNATIKATNTLASPLLLLFYQMISYKPIQPNSIRFFTQLIYYYHDTEDFYPLVEHLDDICALLEASECYPFMPLIDNEYFMRAICENNLTTFDSIPETIWFDNNAIYVRKLFVMLNENYQDRTMLRGLLKIAAPLIRSCIVSYINNPNPAGKRSDYITLCWSLFPFLTHFLQALHILVPEHDFTDLLTNKTFIQRLFMNVCHNKKTRLDASLFLKVIFHCARNGNEAVTNAYNELQIITKSKEPLRQSIEKIYQSLQTPTPKAEPEAETRIQAGP